VAEFSLHFHDHVLAYAFVWCLSGELFLCGALVAGYIWII